MKNRITRNLSELPICGIYQVTNKINGKKYIGQSIDIERRWSQHRYGKGNIILRNAINKYGLDNFEFEILEKINGESKSKVELTELLTEVEQKWFDLEEPYLKENGYNIQTTSKPNLTPNRGDHFGELISKIKINNNHCGKPVCQYDLMGKFIKKWKSAAAVERKLGFHSENISACCLGKQNVSNGFIWRFENEPLTEDDINMANQSLRLSEVRQYDLKGNLLNTFENASIASEKNELCIKYIREACGGRMKTFNRFIWKWKNEPLVLSEHITNKNRQINQYDLYKKLITTWDNVYIAIDNLNYSKHAAKPIYQVCDGIKPNYLGFIWRWY